MLAHVDGGEGFSVHRTYLRPDGNGKAAVEPNKAMLGATHGGSVRLAEGDGPLVVAEVDKAGDSSLQSAGDKSWIERRGPMKRRKHSF